MIPDKFIEVIRLINARIPKDVKWALDGSTSLALQGINITPHDIDILSDSEGAVRIGNSLNEFNTTPVTHSNNEKYDSFFGIFRIMGIKVEVMGDLRVCRNGEWSQVQNPDTAGVFIVELDGIRVPVVSLKSQAKSGYLEERMKREE